MIRIVEVGKNSKDRKFVIGLGFGDEGKGHVVDWLVAKSKNFMIPHVIRYSGGHQAAHCVRDKNFTHIFSNFSSGTYRETKTYWDADTCDPIGIMNEYNELVRKNINPKLFINPYCPVTTPFEKYMNQIKERDNNHGSVGVGFGQTIQREEDNYHLYFMDLFYPYILKTKMEMIEDYYSDKLSEEYLYDIVNNELVDFYEACEKVINFVKMFDEENINFTRPCIFEGSQGLMLDMDYGFFPHVTRSRVGTQNIPIEELDTFYLVTRAYETRHGNGPRSLEKIELDNKTELNETGRFQGKFLSSALNLDQLKYALDVDKNIRESSFKSLVITCLDHLKEYKFIYKNKIEIFKNEKEFVYNIIDRLNIDFYHIYLSYGPTADDIKEYRR